MERIRSKAEKILGNWFRKISGKVTEDVLETIIIPADNKKSINGKNRRFPSRGF